MNASSHSSRRVWLTQTGRSLAIAACAPTIVQRSLVPRVASGLPWTGLSQAETLPAGPSQDLALKGVDAAKSAGAQYTDVRFTRIVQHHYSCAGECFQQDKEFVAFGIRALVNGYWGFAASPFQTVEEVTQLAQNAVRAARSSAKGATRTVDLGQIPVVRGTWATPVAIDPFAVSIEEKRDHITNWKEIAIANRVPFDNNGIFCALDFVRQERVVATSEGSLVTQTVYETAGSIDLSMMEKLNIPTTQSLAGLDRSAKGWELFLDAKIPDQIVQIAADAGHSQKRISAKSANVGRYTIVCDGATMASMVDQTFGVATQIDRALGYEANAGGTSYLDDPLAMLGTLKVASPLVNVTANRSAPMQLATVKWDDEAVVPADFTLVRDGVLIDFQTTREQAAWLAPFYQKQGRPVQSHGCAASESALAITMQHVPNLAMAPSPSGIALSDLVADVANGILIEHGRARCDWQARGGLLQGEMRQIINGRLGPSLSHGAILFDTMDFWKNVRAVGGSGTQGGIDLTQYTLFGRMEKGEPPQATSHSVRAVAATVTNQALIDPTRKA